MGILSGLKLGAAAAVGLIIYLGYLYVVGLTTTITNQAESISTLRAAQLELTEELGNKSAEAATVRAEIVHMQTRDIEKTETINTLERDILSVKRKDQLDKVMQGRPSLFLRTVNRSATCEWLNFENHEGSCVNGVFKETVE